MIEKLSLLSSQDLRWKGNVNYGTRLRNFIDDEIPYTNEHVEDEVSPFLCLSMQHTYMSTHSG